MITRPITRPVTAPLARTVTAGAAIWNPRALFALGEQGWWFDNNDLSTLFQDSAGTTPVTAAGQPVGLQLDKSGRGNHRFQPIAASRPMLRQNAITGAYYLETDGSDDWMVTNSVNFTGTDKVTLLTGVRKLSDAASGILVELSPSIATNNGAFYLPAGDGGPSFNWATKGTVLRANFVTGYPAPISSVLTGVGDIGGDLSRLRINGGVVSQNTGDQGTGNFGNHPAYFFRRGGASTPFNGHEYGSICVGRLCTPAEIGAIERLLAQRTGVQLA